MKGSIKNIFLCFFAILVSLYLLLIAIGGGFKDKVYPLEGITSDIFFAHRGIIDKAPENSIGAIQHALLKGFSAIEVDIMRTKDGELILFHDKNGSRLLGTDIDIIETNYDDIKDIPLKHKGKSSEFKILTLEDLFKKHGDRLVYYLDFKNEHDFELKTFQKINQLINKYDLSDRVLIAGSNLFFTGYIEYKFPNLLTALEGFDTNKEWIYSITPTLFRPDFVAGFFKNVDKSHIKKLRDKNLLSRKIIYGVPTERIQEIYCEYGITKMIVDYDTSIDEMIDGGILCDN
ncbi:MAG: glycerophosphoryl diester phosphodiesterase [Saprospiraceae bacterium]|jgi:glycerophosphoryl diester phosphodiesterase